MVVAEEGHKSVSDRRQLPLMTLSGSNKVSYDFSATAVLFTSIS
jgi:hypothetical protein